MAGFGCSPRAKRTRYSQEVRERAVRMVFEHGAEYASEWAAIQSIAAKIGCTAETYLRGASIGTLDGCWTFPKPMPVK
jgi:transposase-like protein